MTDLTEAERAKIIGDGLWWEAFGERLGWVLIGYTYRMSAAFRNSADEYINVSSVTKADIEKSWGHEQK